MAPAVGITGNMMERVDALVKAQVDVIVVDSAHGHSANILDAVKKIKAAYPDLTGYRRKRGHRCCYQGTDRGRC